MEIGEPAPNPSLVAPLHGLAALHTQIQETLKRLNEAIDLTKPVHDEPA